MLAKLLSFINPIALLSKLVKPGQFESIARSLLKIAGGALLGLGFSQGAVDAWVNSSVPIVSGLLALALGFVASAMAEKKR